MRALERAAVLVPAAATADRDGRAEGSTSVAELGALIAGWALYDLGRPEKAARVLDAEVPRIPATAARSQARYGVRRALAHASAGHVDEACMLATEVLPLVRQVDSATVRVDLARLTRSLRRWHTDLRVRELYPALAEALAPQALEPAKSIFTSVTI
jgi:hypothetical protein